MKIDARHLQQLAVIVDAGTFSEAAGILGTTQPALSRIVGTLEKRIGSPLFERSKRPLVPTEIGREMAKHGRSINAASEHASQLVDYIARGAFGRVKVGAAPFLCERLISETIADFLLERPDVRVELVPAYFHELQDMLLLDQIDLAICPITLVDKSITDFVLEPLFHDENLIVCRSENPLALRSSIGVAELESAIWISHSEKSMLHSDMQAALASSGVTTLYFAFQSESAGAVLAMLRQTDFLTILPRYAIEDRVAKGEMKILPFAMRSPNRTIGIVTHAQRVAPPVRTAFIAHIRRSLKVHED
jgi:DNA-binding transcriptional LysR family regulator